MARRKGAQSGSLDLLLDTICNTFGGILLISLLVIVLLNTTSKTKSSSPVSKDSQSKMLEDQFKMEKLVREVEKLRESVSSIENIQETLAPKEVVDLAKKVQQLEKDRSKQVVDKSRVVSESTQVQAKLNEISNDLQFLSQKIAEAKKQKAALRKTIEEEVDKRSREAVIPKVVQSSKATKWFFLVGGKLYGPGERRNSRDFVWTDDFVSYRPDSGLPITKQLKGIEDSFSGISADRFDIQLWVWPDSYEQYDSVRDVLNQLSFKCSLRMAKEGTKGFPLTDEQTGSEGVQ
jgi:hypothetical protein